MSPRGNALCNDFKVMQSSNRKSYALTLYGNLVQSFFYAGSPAMALSQKVYARTLSGNAHPGTK